mmetsp:Transcript_49286/g.110968  ORF Transcript_49286/g.110968 Transcript_49286/m.110968 type:complete len:302 (-) Transcript_49286:32-937(-)
MGARLKPSSRVAAASKYLFLRGLCLACDRDRVRLNLEVWHVRHEERDEGLDREPAEVDDLHEQRLEERPAMVVVEKDGGAKQASLQECKDRKDDQKGPLRPGHDCRMVSLQIHGGDAAEVDGDELHEAKAMHPQGIEGAVSRRDYKDQHDDHVATDEEHVHRVDEPSDRSRYSSRQRHPLAVQGGIAHRKVYGQGHDCRSEVQGRRRIPCNARVVVSKHMPNGVLREGFGVEDSCQDPRDGHHPKQYLPTGGDVESRIYPAPLVHEGAHKLDDGRHRHRLQNLCHGPRACAGAVARAAVHL